MPTKTAPTRTHLLIRGFFMIAVFVAAGLCLRALEGGGFLNAGGINPTTRDHDQTGQMVFLAVGALFTAFGLPRQVVCFLGGYGFGFIYGTALALTATVIGCVIAFLFARLAGRDLLAHHFSGRAKKFDEVLGKNPFSVILTIRLLPIGSNLVTNLVAGVSSAALWPFVAASIFGSLPQTVVFTLVGSGINVDPAIRLTLGVILFVLSILLGMHLYFRLRKDATLSGVIEIAGGATDADDAPAVVGPRSPD